MSLYRIQKYLICCHENAIMYSLCTAEPQNNSYCCQQYNKRAHSRLHVKSPIFLSGFNQIWIFSIDFHKSLHYQISRKSVQWELTWYKRTDGRTWPCLWANAVNKDPAPFVRQPEWTNTLTSWYVFSYSSFNTSVSKSGYTGIMIGEKKCGRQLQSCKWKYYPRICPAELRQNITIPWYLG
jgi:hypothetical protein